MRGRLVFGLHRRHAEKVVDRTQSVSTYLARVLRNLHNALIVTINVSSLCCTVGFGRKIIRYSLRLSSRFNHILVWLSCCSSVCCLSTTPLLKPRRPPYFLHRHLRQHALRQFRLESDTLWRKLPRRALHSLDLSACGCAGICSCRVVKSLSSSVSCFEKLITWPSQTVYDLEHGQHRSAELLPLK